MVDYLNGKIYGIYSHQTEQIYIGATTQSLCKRKAKHMSKYNEWLNGSKYYTTSFEILKFGDAYIELIENYSCNSREELDKKEGEHIRKFINICVNKCIPANKKQWFIDNKDKLKEKKKIYRLDNKEEIKIKDSEKYQKNKEKIKEQTKIRYNKNNDVLICECFMNTTLNAYNAHIKTERHKELLNPVCNDKEYFKCECGAFIGKDTKCINRHKKSRNHMIIIDNKFYKKVYNFIHS